jgi:hypothetical protein
VSIFGYRKTESGITFLVVDPIYGVEQVLHWNLTNAYLHDGTWTHLLTSRHGTADAIEIAAN